ncbi:MAG TPA: serine/threonine-protein kinase [Solirubrobacteraceae bacterium]|nr:serine/threonine-protein kinase [Solirubrobacteraceae bacterium]
MRTARMAAGDEPADAPTRRRSTRGRTTAEAPIVLDRYRLHRRLGAGAFGTVWMARDERLERDVAVKLLARERIVGGRFEREARAAARLAHPGIVTLYEAAVDDEGAYLVSELVLGSTLDTLLEAGQLSDRDIVGIAIVLCDALEHAHAQGVVHRDVKPSNVLVPDAGRRGSIPSQLAKLTDFGVARVIGSEGLTNTGDVLGTLAYMAPEQAEGLEAGASADLYSLAIVVYEALTGVNPVRATTAFQRARKLGAHLPPLRRQRRDLPGELARAIDRALRPRPRERGTVADLRAALRTARPVVGDEPGIVTDPWTHDDEPEPEEPERFARREGLAVALADDAPRSVWVDRGLAAVGAAAFASWTATRLLAPAPMPATAAALIAAAAVLVLPRLGWLGLIIALCAGALVRGHTGAALLIAIAALAPVLLLPARPSAWPLSAAAPALGLIGLAGAWPALASRAPGTVQRMALGAIGWLWLLLAGVVLGPAHVVYLPHVPGVPPPAAWIGSLSQTTGHLLPALVKTGVLAPAAVWALAAVTVPWLVRGRSLVLDAARVVGWAALVVGATSAAVAAVHGTDAVGAAPTAVLGAAVCAAVALAPRNADGWRRAWRSLPDVGARLP